MVTNLDATAGTPDAGKILKDGAYYLVDDCADKAEMYEKVEEAFFAGIRTLSDASVEAKVRKAGLEQIHLHFPIEKVLLLEKLVEKTLRGDLYHWSYRVGVENLKLPQPFYVDHLIVIRIHYPHEIAKKATSVEAPKRDFSELVSHGISALREPRVIVNQISRAIRRPRKNASYEPDSFHGDLIKPARAHGAHIDTWYGHSYDGINLWWSIRGVNELNSILLYPDMIGRPVAYDEKSMYLASGVAVTEPRTLAMEPGQLLLFNPEILHSTHVNVSDETRIALTTRINPHAPRFNDEAPFNFEHWHASNDLEQKRFNALKVFPASKSVGVSSIEGRPEYKSLNSKAVTYDEALDLSAGGRVCASDELSSGQKLSVDFSNIKLLIWRSEDGSLKAYSRMCPHMGVDLADGWHDETGIHCPGHGLRMNWADGTSACKTMRLAGFDAEDVDGDIIVKRRAKS